MFLWCHEQLRVRHSAITDEVIADEKYTVWSKHTADGRVKSWSVAFVPEFMNSLDSYRNVKAV